MKHYDAVVIGAGNAGLTAAANSSSRLPYTSSAAWVSQPLAAPAGSHVVLQCWCVLEQQHGD
jgi:succinate dehydrogenase/fumarate reductase flavoprotein subunit